MRAKTKFYPRMVPLGSEPQTQQRWIDPNMLLGEFALESGLSKRFFSIDLDTFCFFYIAVFWVSVLFCSGRWELIWYEQSHRGFFPTLNKQMQDGNGRGKVHLVLALLVCVTNNHLHGLEGLTESLSRWPTDRPWFSIFLCQTCRGEKRENAML